MKKLYFVLITALLSLMLNDACGQNQMNFDTYPVPDGFTITCVGHLGPDSTIWYAAGTYKDSLAVFQFNGLECSKPITISKNNPLVPVQIIDFDGDGKADIICAYNNNGMGWYKNISQNQTLKFQKYNTLVNATYGFYFNFAIDLNHSKKNDIIFHYNNDVKCSTWFMEYDNNTPCKISDTLEAKTYVNGSKGYNIIGTTLENTIEIGIIDNNGGKFQTKLMGAADGWPAFTINIDSNPYIFFEGQNLYYTKLNNNKLGPAINIDSTTDYELCSPLNINGNKYTDFLALDVLGGNYYYFLNQGGNFIRYRIYSNYNRLDTLDFVAAADLNNNNSQIMVFNHLLLKQKINSIRENHDLSFKIELLPNPADDYITIENTTLNNIKDEVISIYNIQGQRIIQKPMQQQKMQINITDFTKGVYIVKLSNNENIIVKRFVKE